MPETPIRTLLVEDNPTFAMTLVESLRQEQGVEVVSVSLLKDAMALARQMSLDVVLLDLNLPDSVGLATVERMHTSAPHLPIVVITAEHDPLLGVDLVKAGAEDYLPKSCLEVDLLVRALRHAIERRALVAERDTLIARLEEALAQVKQLTGLLPICAHCKKVRDDQGYWSQIESYIAEHSDAEFSHGICPGCLQAHYGDVLEEGAAGLTDRPGGREG